MEVNRKQSTREKETKEGKKQDRDETLGKVISINATVGDREKSSVIVREQEQGMSYDRLREGLSNKGIRVLINKRDQEK